MGHAEEIVRPRFGESATVGLSGLNEPGVEALVRGSHGVREGVIVLPLDRGSYRDFQSRLKIVEVSDASAHGTGRPTRRR